MYMHVVRCDASLADGGRAGAEAVDPPRFIFRAVRGGAAIATWRSRFVRLDADAYLILGAAEPCLLQHDAGDGAEMTLIAVSAAECDAAQALAEAGPAVKGCREARLRPGHLFTMNSSAGRRLSRIAQARAAGRPLAEEREDRIALVEEAAAQYAALRERAEQLGCVKPATRESLLRRILAASDFIASHFDEPICLAEMARAASLSRFHFVRLFRLLHGETPHAFLLRKRTAVARRRLAEGDGPTEAAARAGFGSRSTLFRNLRKADGGSAVDPSCCLCV
jgi:AraC-like DNA-binding protein